jgi:hypothetical protein
MQISKRTAIIFLCALLPILNACGGTPAPTQTPFIIVITAGPNSSGAGAGAGLVSPTPGIVASTPTTAPANTVAPSLQTAAPTGAPATLATYTGSRAPFTVQYPSDWTVTDPEKSGDVVVISSRDQSSALQLSYGTAGTRTSDDLFQTFVSNFSVPAPKTSNQVRSADGSVRVDLQYNDSTGKPLLGILRLVRQSTSANFYAIVFSATPEKFAQARALGLSLLNSFQERTSSVRTSTPTVVVRETSTSTSIPERATDTPEPTDTPVPTDTPLPPPTNTPRPPAALFRLDAQARGYEDWGAPKDGCNSGATGQWDNNHPIKRLTIDITLMNDSSRPIQVSDIAAGMSSDTGADLLICLVSDVPTAAAHGSTSFGLTTFVEKNQFLRVLRMTIFGSTVRVCFGRNNPPSVVGCG